MSTWNPFDSLKDAIKELKQITVDGVTKINERIKALEERIKSLESKEVI